MAHCRTEQDEWLLAHLKYLLFTFNFFFWVSGHTPPHTYGLAIFTFESLPRLTSPKLMTTQEPIVPCCSEPALP